VPVAGSERFERAVRKDRVLELARAVDVPRPLTARPADVDEASAFAESVGFPVAIKPVDSSGSRGLRFVESPAAFPGAYRAVREEFGPPLVQEKLPEEGTGMGAGFLFWNGELQAEFAYRRLREYPPSGGPSTLRESIAGRELLEPGRRLLESLDWHGVAMVEFKNDVRTDTPKLMEVNPRFWGSLHLPVYAGVDFPRLLVALALGETVETPDYEPGVRCRYLLPGDLLYVAATRDLAPLTDLASRTGEHFDIVSRTDPGPMAGRVAAMIRYAFDREMWRNVVLRGNN
jgi:predicted ATP-grasp superfamily ATP-dependent carboligase